MQISPYSGFKLWRNWFLATLAGFVIGGVLGVGAGTLGFYSIGQLLLLFRVCDAGQGAMGCLFLGAIWGAAIALGISVGIAQWFVLRRFVQRSRWWILACVLGWIGIATTLAFLSYTHIAGPVGQPDGTFQQTTILDNLPYILPQVGWIVVASALMGIFQWLVLRTSLRQAFWWIPTNILIWMLAALVIIFWMQNSGGLLGIAGLIVAFSPIYAAMTGGLLIRLSPRSIQEI
jgi:glucan phosphoethanolaminetransferase (alkaline phosphatase superfamily)